MGLPLVGFRVLLLALLAAVASGFSFPNIENDLDSVDSGLSQQLQQQPQQFSPRIQQPQRQFNFPRYAQQPPNVQPIIMPFSQPSAPTLFQLGSNSHRRRHRHYHRHRKENDTPQTLQQQLSLLQAASAFQNTQRIGTLCQRKALQDRSRCGMQLACFMTQCQVDGSFTARQCDPTSAHCWCVDNQGQEIDRTRVSSQNSGSAMLETQCNSLRRQSLLEIEAAPAPPVQRTRQQQAPVEQDDIRTLSLQEIQAIIAEQAHKMANRSPQKHQTVLSDAHYEKPAVLSDTAKPKTVQKRTPVRNCASACRSKCFVTMDVGGCLGNCDTKCGQQ